MKNETGTIRWFKNELGFWQGVGMSTGDWRLNAFAQGGRKGWLWLVKSDGAKFTQSGVTRTLAEAQEAAHNAFLHGRYDLKAK